MTGQLIVVSFRDKVPEGYKLINTTSRDTEHYGKGLSPFYLRDISLYGGQFCRFILLFTLAIGPEAGRDNQ